MHPSESKSLEPVVILVEPQLGENIGAAARAMLNCGLSDLRLVRPRDGWPNTQAQAAATGAAWVIEEARLYDTTVEAVADLERTYATTARHREMLKPIKTPPVVASEIRAGAAIGERAGLLFGPERTGLSNDDVALASAVLHVPLNPDFTSLNLAQAVLLVCWEWFRLQTESELLRATSLVEPSSVSARATQSELINFFEHLEQELDRSGFLRVAEKRDIMVRNLRNLFHRAELESHEVRTLHGVVSYLVGRRKDGTRVGKRKRSGEPSD